MDLFHALLTKQVQFSCVVSFIDLELFLSVCFMTIHLHHKHKLSLQTFAPFRVITSPQSFITDHLQKAIYCRSSFCQTDPKQVPGASEPGRQPPVKYPRR